MNWHQIGTISNMLNDRFSDAFHSQRLLLSKEWFRRTNFYGKNVCSKSIRKQK